MAKVAFFGLGSMGMPMAKNLLKAGHELHVLVHNGKTAGPEALQTLGAIIDTSLEDMVSDADFIVSIVTNDASVKAVFLHPQMRELVKPGCVILEMTTCSPRIVREVEAYYTDRGVFVLDAPVTGGVAGAIQGTLVILGGGSPEAFEKAEPVLTPLAAKVFQLGKVGNGKLIKAMTNLLGAVNLAAVGEFYRFARAEGLDMDMLMDVVPLSAGGSTQFVRNFPKMVGENYTPPQFTLQLFRKDMGIALDCARACEDLALPLSECALQVYSQSAAFDLEDCCAVAKMNTPLSKQF